MRGKQADRRPAIAGSTAIGDRYASDVAELDAALPGWALDLAARLVQVGESAVAGRLVVASGGNLSARPPGGEQFVITGSGTWFDRLCPADFAVLDLDGRVLSGPPPSTEWKLHQRTYRARPDVNAIVHLHPQYAVLLRALGHPIRLLTLDHVSYVRSVGDVPFHPNGSDELADGAAEQARHHDCLVLAHHGCSALGADVDMAYRRALNLEEAARLTYRALLLGDTDTTFRPLTHQGQSHRD